MLNFIAILRVTVIAAITKLYSVPEREQNIEMVNNTFATPEGIIELIDATNELMTEGVKSRRKFLNALIEAYSVLFPE